MLWTGLAIWVEPVRTTLNYGQVNLVLAAVVLAGMAATTKPVLSGLSVGLTAGIKLTPALSGIYFLATKRWGAAIWSAVAFGATVALAWVVSPAQSRLYWFHLLGQTGRIGPVGSAINQSLRAALSRTVGYDVGTGPIWLVAVAVVRGVVVLRLACVPFAPVTSWPASSPCSSSRCWCRRSRGATTGSGWCRRVLWLLYGRAAGSRLVAVTAVVWLVAVGSFLISFLLDMQRSIWVITQALVRVRARLGVPGVRDAHAGRDRRRAAAAQAGRRAAAGKRRGRSRRQLAEPRLAG